MLNFTGERIVPESDTCEPKFAEKMYTEHLARYVFSSQWVRGKRVLDVGCGVGYGSKWLAENGAASVLGFDISVDAIDHAQKYYSHQNVTFEVASATEFDFGEKFDVVVCFELIEHVERQAAVIERIRKALKSDGVMIMSTPRALDEVRGSFHVKEFSEHEFRDLLDQQFPSTHFYFENNHFCSLITDRQPNQLDDIVALKDQYTLSKADYFIAVASVSENGLTDANATLVIGDDQYIKLLEKDLRILRDAEARLVEEVKHEKSKNILIKQAIMKLLSELDTNA